MKSGIYRYTNLINGKRYIGQAKDLNARYSKHLSIAKHHPDKGSLLDKAIAKYGIDNFRYEVLEFCEPEQMNDLEIYWINYYNTNVYNGGYGYNRNNGGDGHGGKAWNSGKKGCWSEETLKKFSESHKGLSFSKGTHLTKEHKQKLSNYFKGKPNPKNKGELNGMYGKVPWNKGLTKETDNRVAKYANSGSIARKDCTPWNKGQTGIYSWYYDKTLNKRVYFKK